VLHVAIGDGVASLGRVQSTLSCPFEMGFVDISIGVSDGGRELTVGISERLDDGDNLGSKLKINRFDCLGYHFAEVCSFFVGNAG